MKYHKLIVLLAVLCTATAAHTGSAQNDIAYSFTSGGWGDGFDWPRSQQGYRTSSGAISGDQFDTPDSVSFNSYSGNLSFFDSNNLLTAPSAFINGAAWWTDVKTVTGNYAGNTFTTAAANIGFWNMGGLESDFGFDVAIASVSGPLPDSIGITFATSAGFYVFGTLSFEPVEEQESYEGEPIWAVSTGSFFTLGSPHPAYEGRFRFDIQELQFWIYDQAQASEDFSGFYDDPSQILIDSIDLEIKPLATNNGTTQFAVDNFIIGGASVPPPVREVKRIPDFGPIGENTPFPVVYADTQDLPPDVEQDLGDSFGDADLNDLSNTDYNASSVLSEMDAGAFSVGSSIFFEGASTGAETGELAAHESTHQVQGGDPPTSELSTRAAPATGDSTAAELSLGWQLTLQNWVFDGGGDLQRNGAVAPGLQVVELSGPTSDDLAMNISLEHQYSSDQAIVSTPQDVGGPTIALRPQPAITITGSPSFYHNFSAQAYLQYKDALSEPLIEGDAGSIVVPALDDEGRVIDYEFSAWFVTDNSGNFVASIINPLPSSPFERWSRTRGLTFSYGERPEMFLLEGPAGQTYGESYALDTDPQGHTTPPSKWLREFLTDGGAEKYFSITLPVRVGAGFSGNPLSATVDGVTYTLNARSDLSGTPLTLVERSAGPSPNAGSLPVPGDYDETPGPDWEYRTFRLTTPQSTTNSAYFWIDITEPQP